jgi:hypothetical protein
MAIGDVSFLMFHSSLIGIPIGAAWISWIRRDRQNVRPLRKKLATLGLGGVSLSGIAFVGFAVHAMLIGGMYGQWSIYHAWMLPGSVVAIVSPWFALAARGWSRALGIAGGLWVVFLWGAATMI